MPLLVRLTALIVIISVVITVVVVARQEPTDAEQSISNTADSWAELTSQNGEPVVEYGLNADDALIIRFGQEDLRSCVLIVLIGPRSGRESAEADIDVDYEIVPVDNAQDRAESLASACDEAWIATR